MMNEPTAYDEAYLGQPIPENYYQKMELQEKNLLTIYKLKGKDVYFSLYKKILVEICYDKDIDKTSRKKVEEAILIDSINEHGNFDKKIQANEKTMYIWYGEEVNMVLYVTNSSLKISYIHKNSFIEYIKENKKTGV